MASKASGLVNNLLTAARPQLQIISKYALAELTPPKPGDIPAIRAGIVKIIRGATSGAWKKTPVREAWLNALVTVEVLCWFYVGECIGKRNLVGYNV